MLPSFGNTNPSEKGKIGTLSEGMCVHSSMRSYQLCSLGRAREGEVGTTWKCQNQEGPRAEAVNWRHTG